jgi:hypothetical protein
MYGFLQTRYLLFSSCTTTFHTPSTMDQGELLCQPMLLIVVAQVLQHAWKSALSECSTRSKVTRNMLTASYGARTSRAELQAHTAHTELQEHTLQTYCSRCCTHIYELHVISGALPWVQAALRACPALRAGVGCYCLLPLHARCCHHLLHQT